MAGGLAGETVGFVGQTLFPHFCLVCGKEGRLLCADCETQKYSPERGILFSLSDRRSVTISERMIRCFSAGRYSDPVLRELLHLYKYGRVEEAGRILADFLSVKVGRQVSGLLEGDSEPLVVPMPMNRINLALRGFNQADALAEAVARELELETVEDGVVLRRFAWRPQARLADPKMRSRNVSGAFMATKEFGGRDVLLVDDVFTTGATVLECAAVIGAAGAERVTVVTALKG